MGVGQKKEPEAGWKKQFIDAISYKKILIYYSTHKKFQWDQVQEGVCQV
jgi:hypothetical protein